MRALSWRGTGLFAVLVLIGSGYLVSLAYFSIHSINYLDAGKMQRAQEAATHARLPLPATLDFNNRSSWLVSLVSGWQSPESWGVWGRDAHATLLLPPLADASVHEFCVAITFGSLPPRKSWPMEIVINDAIVNPTNDYHGGGPFTIHATAATRGNEPIRIDFYGPKPIIPRSFDRHNHDYRTVSFSLFKVVLTRHCS